MEAERIGMGTLTASLANVDDAAVAASHIRYVKAVTLCNTSVSAQHVTMTFAGTNVIYEYSIPGTGGENTITIPFFDQVMEATERIQAKAETTAVVDFYISGREVDVS